MCEVYDDAYTEWQKERDRLEQQLETHEATIAELQEANKKLKDDFGKALFFLPSSLRAEFFKTEDWESLITPPDSKPKLLDHNTSEDCWCEPEEVSDGVFVHKDRH